MEFQVTTDLKPIAGMTIEANFSETEAALQEMMAPYQAMVVTPDTIQAAKSDRAKIRAVGKRIDDYRIATKRQWMKPVEDFEKKCKTLSAVCEKAAGNLDKQIKGFDEDRRKAKMDDLRKFYEANAGEMGQYRGFDDVASPQWGNATYDVGKAEQDILAMASKFSSEMSVIRGMGSPYDAALIEAYIESGTLADVMRKNAQMLERSRLERERREAAEKKAAKAAQTLQPDRVNSPHDTEPKAEDLIEIKFLVRVTRSQMEALKAFMRQAGIRPERV